MEPGQAIFPIIEIIVTLAIVVHFFSFAQLQGLNCAPVLIYLIDL